MLPRRFYLDSIFDDFMDGDERFDMKCDIYEKDNNYHIVCDIPGVGRENIKIEYSDGYLTILAEKKEQRDENNGKKVIRKERFFGKTSRRFYIGNIDEAQIKAEFKDGTLIVDIPKEKFEKNKRIIDIM